MKSRVILHIDMNSYFATLEQQANPFLRGRPIAVGGSPTSPAGRPGTRTIVVAVSQEAKKWGVRTPTSSTEALKICPELFFVPCDFDRYIEVHDAFVAIFQRYTELVEVFSIDEAYLDVTGYAERYFLASLRGVPRRNVGERRSNPESSGIDHLIASPAFRERRDRNDTLLQGAIIIAQQIKQAIRDEIGEWVTCSVGIASNKKMAKLAANMQKPDGLTMLTDECLPDVLEVTPIADICGIGPRLEARLHVLGVRTLGQLGRFSLRKLEHAFGPVHSRILHNMGIGEDPSPVIPITAMPPEKSISKQYTLPVNTRDKDEIARVLLKLAEQVGRRLRGRRRRATEVFWHVCWEDFTRTGGRKKTGQPLWDGNDIFYMAWSAISRMLLPKAVRLVGIGTSCLRDDYGQRELFTDVAKKQRLLVAIDAVNDIYGEFTIRRASITNISDMRNAKGNALQKRYW